MNKNKYLSWAAAAGFVAGLVMLLPVFAQAQVGAPNGSGHFGMRGGMPPGVFGTVTAINGNSLTVTAKTRPNATSTTGTVYSVDASAAQVFKNGTTSTIGSIASGDMVMVQGTVSGTSVAATVIRDGIRPMMGGRGMPGGFGKGYGKNGTSTPPVSPIQGNGQPVIGGAVTAISGTTVTITNASNVTYTIDASNAKVVKGGASSTIASVATGDNLVVQGTVNGTSVVASSIIDQGATGSRAPPAGGQGGGSHFGFLGAIGSFFKHLFGF